MSWSHWIYLAFGLGIGLSTRWIAPKSNAAVSPTPATDLSLQQLRQTQLAYQLAQEMSQFKAGFLVRTAHELRSPLNSLIGLHQLILSDLCDNPAEEREFVAQAHQLALKLVGLLDEILDVARTENGSNTLEIQPLQLTAVLQDIDRLTHTIAANRAITLQTTLPHPETYILADPRWLRQALVNLVDICINKMEGGVIAFSAQVLPEFELVHIYLDVPLSPNAWSEPLDAMLDEHLSQAVEEKTSLSPELKLLITQTLLTLIKGKLEISSVADAPQSTRLQVSIPLVIPEAELLEPEANLV